MSVETREGALWKKSPGTGFYQERKFTLYQGILSYQSGKGELVKVHLNANSKFQLTNAERLEFSVDGTDLASATSASKNDRVFHFRATGSSDLALWTAAVGAVGLNLQLLSRGHTEA